MTAPIDNLDDGALENILGFCSGTDTLQFCSGSARLNSLYTRNGLLEAAIAQEHVRRSFSLCTVAQPATGRTFVGDGGGFPLQPFDGKKPSLYAANAKETLMGEVAWEHPHVRAESEPAAAQRRPPSNSSTLRPVP